MRRHKSAFCSVQLSVPDLLKDWINNCPPHFQDKPLKWAAVQKQNTPYSIFVVLRIVQTSQVFIFPTVSQTHLINAASVTLGVSVWAPVSNFNKFTAIENDAPGFQLFPLLWEETSCYFFGGNGLFCTFVQLYQMLHNSGLQLPHVSVVLCLMWVFICDQVENSFLCGANRWAHQSRHRNNNIPPLRSELLIIYLWMVQDSFSILNQYDHIKIHQSFASSGYSYNPEQHSLI